MRTFRVPCDRANQLLANAGYRLGGRARSRLGLLYQFSGDAAVRFCEVACDLGIYLEELR